MGRIYNRFGSLKYQNEAEVSQNFLIPLLMEFLGYRPIEVLPEHLVPAFDIPQNRGQSLSSRHIPRKAKPDYVLAIGPKQYAVVCDSKGPDESLDDHMSQLRAYCIALGTNLLLITNGTELRVYDANEPIFRSATPADLDLRFEELFRLLNRADVARLTDAERIQRLDLDRSLGKDSATLLDEQRRRVAVAVSDFEPYLRTVCESYETPELPPPVEEAFGSAIRRLPAEQLYLFRSYEGGGLIPDSQQPLPYEVLLEAELHTPLLLVGESGIGKTSLLQQIAFDQARLCLQHTSDTIPVLVKLGLYSTSRALMDVIYDALYAHGATIARDELRVLLRDGRFVLLLDAFDEVAEATASQLGREIQALVEGYGRNRLIITTRRFRLPSVSPIKRYELQPLGSEQIEAFAKMQLGTESAAFLEEIERSDLMRLASNTLILSVLVLLYRGQARLPHRRGLILEAVVSRIREWNDLKPERFSYPLAWGATKDLLVSLAYHTLSAGKGYSLERESLEKVIAGTLGDLESRRLIPAHLSVDHAMASLAATGFVSRADAGIIFWHRAFMEYFAAIGLSKRVFCEPDVLSKLISSPNWEAIFPLAASVAPDHSDFVTQILSHNVFIAGRALAECDITEGQEYSQIVDALYDRCRSAARPIRQIALECLCQIKGVYADRRLEELLDADSVDVQKTVLVEIARRKTPSAREAVMSRLAWDVPASHAFLWDGPSSTAVIEALGEFDDLEAHLKIVSMWQDKSHMFMNMACRTALLKIGKRGKLSPALRRALVELYLAEDREATWRAHELGDVLMVSQDVETAERLLSSLKEVRRDDISVIRALGMVRILAASDDPAIVQQLIVSACDRSLDACARTYFADALSRSKGEVPLHVFEALAQDPSNDVRAHGVRGLGRFPFDAVSAIVLQAVHPPPFEESMMTGHSYARVQAAAFEVLAEHGAMELLLQREHRPAYTYNTSDDVLLAAIKDKHLRSMYPIVESIAEHSDDRRAVIAAAYVMADLEYMERSCDIIDKIRADQYAGDWVAHDILAGIHRLPSSYALEVIDGIQARQQEMEHNRSDYLRTKCIEALARVGTAEACERLCRIATSDAEDVGVLSELALRSIELLAPRDRETWLICFIKDHASAQSFVLRRALEALGVVGSDDALPVLREHMSDPHPMDIQETCFWAIHSIHKRMGHLWYNGEEKAG